MISFAYSRIENSEFVIISGIIANRNSKKYASKEILWNKPQIFYLPKASPLLVRKYQHAAYFPLFCYFLLISFGGPL